MRSRSTSGLPTRLMTQKPKPIVAVSFTPFKSIDAEWPVQESQFSRRHGPRPPSLPQIPPYPHAQRGITLAPPLDWAGCKLHTYPRDD